MKYKRPMKIEHLVSEESGFGDGTPDRWEEFASAPTSLFPVRGQELIIAQQNKSQVTHSARCRYIPGVNSGMRLRYGDRVFSIASVANETEKNRFLVFRLIETTT